MTRVRKTLASSMIVGLSTLGLLLLMAGSASARQEVLRWTHPSPSDIARFEALYGTSSGNYGSPISLGKPNADSGGVFSAGINVPDNATVYIVVRAVGTDGQVSDPSNQRVRTAPAPAPAPEPSPTPPSGGSGGESEIPSNANATLRFDFGSGQTPDWVDTGANNSMATNDGLFSVTSVDGNAALTTQSNATNIHSHYLGSQSDLANITYTGRMRTTNAGGGIGVTAYSLYPIQDFYYRLRATQAGESFELSGHSSTCSGDTDTGVVAQANTWYVFEFTVATQSNSNRITAKVWRQGDAKPSSVQADCVDSSSTRPGSGAIGVWSMGSGTKYWDDLEVTAEYSGNTTLPVSGPPEPPVLIDIKAVQ